MMQNQLLLSQYTPVSELQTAEHPVPFPKYPVFDVHTHFGPTYMGECFEQTFDIAREVEQMRSFGVYAVVNLDGMTGSCLDRMLEKTRGWEDFFVTFAGVTLQGFGTPSFEREARQEIFRLHEKGVRGLKFFKEFTLDRRDAAGNRIPLDDSRYQVLWQTAAELDMPVLMHVGDPPAFFKPIDARNERYDELVAHPEWSFYQKGTFSFEELMEMQKNLLARNPRTQFIFPHGGSWSENLAWVGSCLDQYPNMYLDIAARVSELGRQPYTAKEFCETYSTRILFGTDGGPGNKGYPYYYRLLESRDDYFPYSSAPIPPQGRWNIYGLGLSDQALRNIYHANAERLILKREAPAEKER